MFAHFTTTNGREVWISAVHVKVVRAKKNALGRNDGGSEIWFSWNSMSESIDVPLAPEEVAAQLLAVMPRASVAHFCDDEDEDTVKPPSH